MYIFHLLLSKEVLVCEGNTFRGSKLCLKNKFLIELNEIWTCVLETGWCCCCIHSSISVRAYTRVCTLPHTHTHTECNRTHSAPQAGSRMVEVYPALWLSAAWPASSLHTHEHQQAIMKNISYWELAILRLCSKERPLFWGNSVGKYF